MRTTLTIPRDLKAHLEILAKDDMRSVNNLIISILDNHVRSECPDYKEKK